ncbi:MAG: uroporphyrinogen decarboxylase, partial [Nitrospinota bacterium]
MEAALAGRLADRPPISIWKHYPTRDTTAEGLVEAMVEHQRKFNWDFIKVMPHGLYCVEDWGCRIRFPRSP